MRPRAKSRALDYIAEPGAAEWPINCEGNEDLCKVVKATAIRREMLVAVSNSAITGQLEKWIDANRRAKIANMLIVAIDNRLPSWLEARGVAFWAQADKALGSHKISAQKFKYVRSFLSIGCSVLMSDIDVVYLQNPFLFVYGDADIEGTTDGWDDGSAYGWMEQLDDPSLGASGRFRPAMRITAWNSGLWYARATKASLRLMTILAYRMENEPNTWDQAAFGEEVARPARDGHLAAGLVKRALSYWCFANSKTVFRRMRIEPPLASHMPVVVHANYHQPKEPRMKAVYERWHLQQPDALHRFPDEPTTVTPAPELEKDFLHSINDGFVSGADHRSATEALESSGCKPRPSLHGVAVTLHLVPSSPCDGDPLCAAAARLAVPAGEPPRPEILLVCAGKDDAPALRLLLSSATRAGVTNLLVATSDGELEGELGDASAGRLVTLSGGGDAAAFKWAAVLLLVSRGFGVLSAHPTTVLVANPFDHLYRDADIEAMSLGWDDPSAYGYNHVIDDPSMGFTRFCHGSRIVGYEPRLFYASPSAEAAELASRMRTHLAASPPKPVGPGSSLALSPAKLEGPNADEVAERELLLQQLWLPSHKGFVGSGAILRVMNYLCFVNSKVMFRKLRHTAAPAKPILVSIDYHTDPVPRMQALIAKYHDGDGASLASLPLADTTDGSKASSASCADAGREWRAADAQTAVAQTVMGQSPWAWGGVGGFSFEANGKLTTPWGQGSWGVHSDGSEAVFADFVGAKHNLVLSHSVAVSTRCSDSNVVLLRSVKNAKT